MKKHLTALLAILLSLQVTAQAVWITAEETQLPEPVFTEGKTAEPEAVRKTEPQAGDTYNMPIKTVFYQSDARASFDDLNALRTGGDNWWYNDNSKSSVSWGNGQPLTYDYDLEMVAMQRAVEIAVDYDHTRPDGTEWKTAHSEMYYSLQTGSENIAIVYGPGADGIIDLFAEEEYGYSGQAHRRAMLNPKYTCTGIACAQVGDMYCWVQEFNSVNQNPYWTSPYNGTSWYDVRIPYYKITGWRLSPDPFILYVGQTVNVGSEAVLNFIYNNYKTVPSGWPVRWTSDNQSVVSADDSYTVTGVSKGTAQIRAGSPDGRSTVTATVEVRAEYQPDGYNAWTWSDDRMSATLRLISKVTGQTVTLNAKMTIEYSRKPTCTSSGAGTVTAAVTYNGETYTDSKYAGSIPALGHDWGKPVYSWSGSPRYMNCTAERTCRRESSHTDRKTVRASYTVTKEPTCTTAGKAEYTADFGEGYTVQHMSGELPKTDHELTDIKYTWAEDHSTCTATARCTLNGGHTVKETVKTEMTVVREATETQSGMIRYMAKFTTAGFKDVSSYVTVPKKPKPTPTPKPTPAPTPVPTPKPSSNGTDMHRLYNPNSGEHFYTGDVKEMNTLVQRGWKYEGVGWTAPKTSKTPVYRLYNINGGEHHYTTSKKERDVLVERGWQYEKVGWYSDDAKKVKIYREYNPNAFANNHNYTADVKEHNALINKYGWKDEKIAWYAIGGKKQ